MRRPVPIAAIAVALFAVLVGVEQLRSDEPFDLFELLFDIFEMLLLGGAVLLTAKFSAESRAMRDERRDLIRDLRDARAESERWRASARTQIDGLSRAIARQFREWDLTSAEVDVAFLMLKGLSHKEIATLRDTSQATVRQHATTVYRKSGLTNRSQLTAFFLEDLLAPEDRTTRSAELSLVNDTR